MASSSEIEVAMTVAIEALGYKTVREKQLEVVEAFISGNDVLGVLPTGYGKSLCYACLPLIFDHLLKKPASPSIVVVVTPLLAIMNDQVQTWSKRGLSVASVTGNSTKATKRGVAAGEYQLVFFTPELLITKRKWRQLFSTDVYKSRVRAFIVDEAHCMKKWGDTFRTALRKVGEIRSVLPEHVNVMALTATATRKLQESIKSILGMRRPIIVSVPPCKANIVYGVGTFKAIEETFSPLLERLRKERQRMSRMIVYCRTYNMCADLFHYFKMSLGGEFTEPPFASDLNKYGLVNMHLGCTSDSVKAEIGKQYTDVSSPLRIIFATSSFGMGVDCSDVQQVIHVGITDDIESYIQGTGRAGRDGKPALALLLRHGSSNQFGDKEILEYQSNSATCRRDFLFRDVDGYEHTDLGVKCLCCDICAEKCSCGKCNENHISFQFIGIK